MTVSLPEHSVAGSRKRQSRESEIKQCDNIGPSRCPPWWTYDECMPVSTALKLPGAPVSWLPGQLPPSVSEHKSGKAFQP